MERRGSTSATAGRPRRGNAYSKPITRQRAESVDGIVGADFLSRDRAITDYYAPRLWLRAGDG